MSGDVQPRKRKDKRRKKDDAPGPEEPAVQPAGSTPPPTVNEDFNIHVHNDHGTGGGICAKLVFFALLSILAVLIGMIFIEKRGLTDLDIAPTESRFAKVFDGWIDESFNDHEEDHAHSVLEDHDDHEELEDHEESEEEHASVEEDHDDHDEEHDEEHEEEEEEQQVSEEQQLSEEQEEDDEAEDEEQLASEEAEDETEEQQASEETEEQQASEEEEMAASHEVEEDDEQDEEELQASEEQQGTEEADEVQDTEKANDIQETDEDEEVYEDEETEEQDEEEESQNIVESDDDDGQTSNEEIEETEANDEDDNDATNEDNDEQDDDDNTVEAEDNTSREVDDDNTIEADDNASREEALTDEDMSKENEIFEEEESMENTADIGSDDQEEEVVDNTAGEEDVLREEAEKEVEAEQEESSSMAVKFGVGVALVVVAHVVLVRKWRSGKPSTDKPVLDEEIITDLSRRNTIVPPVPLEQIENEIQNDEDEYSEEETEDESEEEIIIETVPVKKSYQELQSTYSRTLPPEIVTKATLESKSPQPRVVYYPRVEDEEEEEEEDIEEDQEEDEEEVEEGEDVEEGEEGDENEENEEDDISDVDDEELLKKLEARYGKLPSSRDNRVDEGKDTKLGPGKSFTKITSSESTSQSSSEDELKVLPDVEDSERSEDENWTKRDSVPADLQKKLKLAEANVRDNPELAHTLFTNLMEQLPDSNRIQFGRAQALDQLAEVKRSNQLLQDAISSYYDLLQSPTISDKLYINVAERCIDRIRFRGHYNRAVQIHKDIIDRFPNNPKFRNQLAVTLLTSNRLAEAKSILQEVLTRWPNDGFALAHFGFILKTKDNDLEAAIEYMQRGIESRVSGVIDGRFYFHLGDALQRLGRNNEAMKIYEDGVENKVFLSKYQRSLYNVDHLTGRPWWALNQTPYASFFKLLESKWKMIRDEGLALLDTAGYFKDEAENLRDTGQWMQFELFARGQKFMQNCKKCPVTCAIIENLPDARGCKRGQVKFSVMHPGTHVWPHCGPSNCRLRAHLGLKIPLNTFIRVAEETRSWREGKVFIFDDSFEHEVWHNGSDVRLVLIVDVWHPELTTHEKRSLPGI